MFANMGSAHTVGLYNKNIRKKVCLIVDDNIRGRSRMQAHLRLPGGVGTAGWGLTRELTHAA